MSAYSEDWGGLVLRHIDTSLVQIIALISGGTRCLFNSASRFVLIHLNLTCIVSFVVVIMHTYFCGVCTVCMLCIFCVW